MADSPARSSEHLYVPIGDADSASPTKPRTSTRLLLAASLLLFFLFWTHKRDLRVFLKDSRTSDGGLKVALFAPYALLCLCSFGGLVYVHAQVIRGRYTSKFGFRVSVAIALVPWVYLAPLLLWLSM